MSRDSGVTIIIAAEDNSGAVMDAVEARLKRASESGQQFGRSMREAGESAIPPMTAASATVRTFQGNILHNTRAVERFLSTTLGLGPVMEAAFPVVGAIAFGAVLIDNAKKLYDFRQEMLKMPEAIDAGFGRLHESLESTKDDLDLTTAKLESAIAKIEGRPQNGIKVALLEDLKAADDLAKRIDDIDGKIAETLTKNQVTKLGAVVSGQVSTTDITKQFDEYQKRAAEVRRTDRELVDQAATDEQRKFALAKQASDQYRLSHEEQQKLLEGAKADQGKQDNLGLLYQLGGVDYSSRIRAQRDLAAALSDRDSVLASDDARRVTEGQHDKLQENAEDATKAAEAIRKQQEFLEKAAKAGIGNIYQGGRNVSDETRQKQLADIDDKQRGALQDGIGGYEKQQEQERQAAAERKRMAEEVARQEYEAAREVQEARIREAQEARRIADAQANYDLQAGRITAQQRVDIARQAAEQELSVRQDALATLRALDISSSAADLRAWQRDYDAELQAQRQFSEEMIRQDQQAFEARREAIRPFVDDIFQPLMDGPRKVSDAFRRMAQEVEGTLARMAEQRVINAIAGGGAGSAGGGAATRSLGGVLGSLWGAISGRGTAKTGRDAIQPSGAAAALGAAGAGAGAVNVTIINQGSQPISAASSNTSKDQAGNLVLSVILKDADKLGPITQALGGALKMIP